MKKWQLPGLGLMLSLGLAPRLYAQEIEVAALVKKSEAESKARCDAIRYLATVDCKYWPNVGEVLKTSMRKDPMECVRYEAALALGRGSWCTKGILEWLKDSTSGADKFGPMEMSGRVRAAAGEALAHCAAGYQENPAPIAEKEKQKKEGLSPSRASSRGQGLVGIFTAASDSYPAKMAPLPAREPTMVVMVPKLEKPPAIQPVKEVIVPVVSTVVEPAPPPPSFRPSSSAPARKTDTPLSYKAVKYAVPRPAENFWLEPLKCTAFRTFPYTTQYMGELLKPSGKTESTGPELVNPTNDNVTVEVEGSR